MIRRPPRSTQSRSSAASDVYKRQLPALRPPNPRAHGRPARTPRGPRPHPPLAGPRPGRQARPACPAHPPVRALVPTQTGPTTSRPPALPGRVRDVPADPGQRRPGTAGLARRTRPRTPDPHSTPARAVARHREHPHLHHPLLPGLGPPTRHRRAAHRPYRSPTGPRPDPERRRPVGPAQSVPHRHDHAAGRAGRRGPDTVSYTHLTLPTI